MIIRAFVYERPYSLDAFKVAKEQLANFLKNKQYTPRGAFKSSDGLFFMDYDINQPLLRKKRFLVVVRIGENRIIALPCYTNQGRGTKRTGGYSTEVVGVRDDRAWPIGRKWEKQGPHDPLITRNMTSDIVIKAETTADMSNPVTFLREDPSWTIEGDIRKESFIRLKDLLQKYGWNLASRADIPEDEDGGQAVDDKYFGQGYHYAAKAVNAPPSEEYKKAKEKAAKEDDVIERLRRKEIDVTMAEAEMNLISRSTAGNAPSRETTRPGEKTPSPRRKSERLNPSKN